MNRQGADNGTMNTCVWGHVKSCGGHANATVVELAADVFKNIGDTGWIDCTTHASKSKIVNVSGFTTLLTTSCHMFGLYLIVRTGHMKPTIAFETPKHRFQSVLPLRRMSVRRFSTS